MSQEEPFHVDMASTRDDDVAKCAAQILERFSRPKLRVAVHKPSRIPLTVMHASFQEPESAGVSAEELTNENIVKLCGRK